MKDQKTALILCACGFVGIGGLHYFYIGKIGKGLLYLFTGGLFLIGTIIDLLNIATGKFCVGKGTLMNSMPSPAQTASTHEYKVYIEMSGTKFHADEHCSGMTGARYVPLSVAQKEGRTACKKCAEHVSGYYSKPSPVQPAASHSPVSQPMPTAPVESEYEFLKFKVAGVTFKNGRKSRQTILRKIKFRDEPFDKGDFAMTLQRYEYEGNPAFGVYVNDEQIGSVPAEHTAYLEENFSRILGFTHIDVYGGGEGKSFGAEVILRLKK